MPATTSTTQESTRAVPTTGPAFIPTLENGDRLTRSEFERRYRAMPQVKKAELVEGVVYMSSPVRLDVHGEPNGLLVMILGRYRSFTPGTGFGDNSTVRLDLDNEPQPDALLFIHPEVGGQATIDAEGYLAGAPELIAEVAASSVSYDLGPKKHVYRRNGVREYLVWRVQDRALDWFLLHEGRYEPLAPDAEGLLKSPTFPGLWLDPAALLAGDMPRVHQVLDAGLKSPEHAAFVEKLRAASRSG